MADEEYSLSEFEEDEESFEESDGESYESENDHVDESKDFSETDKELHNLFESTNLEDVGGDEFAIQSPEILLATLRKEDDTYLEFESLKVNRIKCLGLCKIIFGHDDWRTAEAHIQLAEAYTKGKWYHQQSLKHANLARDILLAVQNKNKGSVPYLELESLLQNMYLILGKTNLKLGRDKASENCLLKAKLVSDKTQSGSIKFQLLRVSILSALADTSSKLGNFGQSTEFIEEALENVHKMDDTYKHLAINLYKQMVNIELLNEKYANLDAANDSAQKALSISIDENGHDFQETAELFTLLCKVESLREISDYDKIEKNISEALGIYETLDLNEKQISTLQIHCKILMQQDKLVDAKSLLDGAIEKCENWFGDCSLQTAELYDLMGSILFAQKRLPNALSYFTKAFEIYDGKRKCLKKKEKLKHIIEIIRKTCKDDKLKTSEERLKERPRFA